MALIVKTATRFGVIEYTDKIQLALLDDSTACSVVLVECQRGTPEADGIVAAVASHKRAVQAIKDATAEMLGLASIKIGEYSNYRAAADIFEEINANSEFTGLDPLPIPDESIGYFEFDEIIRKALDDLE